MTPEGRRIILPDAWRWMPWRNGGGRTAEIHVEGDAEAPDWRLSLAIIERDGPFSAWPGMDRTLVWLDGSPLDLDFDGEHCRLDRIGACIEFAGEDAVGAKVAQRTTVLNLMVRRAAEISPPMWIAHAIGAASVRMGDRQLDVPAQATLIAHTAVEPVAGKLIVLEVSA